MSHSFFCIDYSRHGFKCIRDTFSNLINLVDDFVIPRFSNLLPR